ncbi:MAG: hypothetical protein KJ077_11150 [Anaerolineae bacterium]|nr:hypothetical protein [Anaerolineae bacterium]
MEFFKAQSAAERQAINLFLDRHNSRGHGSNKGFVAYYAVITPPDGRLLGDRIVAAAKFCPLHTPQAAKFFGAAAWRQVYCLQRLAALHPPQNLLSRFIKWCLKDMGSNPKVWFVATYASVGDYNATTGRPHDGGVYRASNAVYCGKTPGGQIEGYVHEGQRYSMRRGPRTLKKSDIPAGARILRAPPMHRYCWAVGSPLPRAFRRRDLQQRMAKFKFVPIYQPRLLYRRLISWINAVKSRIAFVG